MEPESSVALLSGNIIPTQLAMDQLDMDYAYTTLQTNEGWIDTAQQKKILVNTWTVDTKPDMIWLITGKNINFIMTNEPELALTIGK